MKPLLTYKTARTGPNKPWLILLPGVTCGAWFFKDAFTPLSSHFNLIAVNNPGVAESPLQPFRSVKDIARHVFKIMQAEKVETAHVLGHSMGGFVAQELALLAPRKVERLVLVSTCMGQPYTAKDLLTLAKTTGKTWQQYNREIATDPEQALQVLFGRSFLTEQADAYQKFLRDRKRDFPSKAASALHIAMGGTFSNVGKIGNITAPTLVIHGDADPLITSHSARVMAESLPQSFWWELLDVGHFPMLESPAFWPHTIGFLQGSHVGQGMDYLPHEERRFKKLKNFWERLKSWQNK